MAFTTVAKTAILSLLLKNTTWAGVGDATGLVGSSVAGNLYISLHTADPTVAGTQTSSEATYTSYARVAVVRSASGWTVATGAGDNVAAINFPACTGGSSTVTHVGLGTASSGAGILIAYGTLDDEREVTNGVTPSIAAEALDVALSD